MTSYAEEHMFGNPEQLANMVRGFKTNPTSFITDFIGRSMTAKQESFVHNLEMADKPVGWLPPDYTPLTMLTIKRYHIRDKDTTLLYGLGNLVSQQLLVLMFYGG